MLEELAD